MKTKDSSDPHLSAAEPAWPQSTAAPVTTAQTGSTVRGSAEIEKFLDAAGAELARALSQGVGGAAATSPSFTTSPNTQSNSTQSNSTQSNSTQSNSTQSNSPHADSHIRGQRSAAAMESATVARTAAGPASRGDSRLPTPTVDWNAIGPDGTEESLERLLAALGGCFRASVFLGQVSSTGSLGKLFSTDKVWTTMKKRPIWLKNMLAEAAQSTRPLGSSPLVGMMTAVMLQANHQLGTKQVFGVGFQFGAGLPKLGLVMAQDARVADADAETAVAQLSALQPALRKWLDCWLCNLVGRTWTKRKAKFFDTVKPRPKLWGTIALAMVGLMWLPLPYWPKRECVLEPAVRQYIASPVAGRVLTAEVRPGDTVRKGQVLARLDDEQLRWDLSTAQAEYEAAAKKRDTALANKSAGNVRVAQLELEQIAVRIESIKAHLDRLSVSSPIDGVILQGEWFRSPGAPVNRGDCLFEIAPLERMTVEAHLRTEDLGQIRVGNPVSLRVDAASDRTWQGEVLRIDPRAKVVDDQVVFTAEVEVTDAQETLRPGMKGTVTITAGTRSLGWLLFSRPYQWMMKKLLW